MDLEIDNCPFCGGPAEIRQTGKNKMQIRCTSCLVGKQQKVLRMSLEWLREALIKDWNKRV